MSSFGNGFFVFFKERGAHSYTFWTKADSEPAALADALDQLKQRTGKAAWTCEVIEARSIEIVPVAPSVLFYDEVRQLSASGTADTSPRP